MSQEQGASVKDCPKYLEALPIPAAVKQSAPLLFKPLSQALVEEVLLRQVPGPRQDWMGFRYPFIQVSRHSFHHSCSISYSQLRSQGCFAVYPEGVRRHGSGQGAPHSTAATQKKWFMTVLLLQVEDLFMQITLPQQVGCFKHWHMIQHIWSVQGQWSRGAVVCELSPPAFCHHAPRWKCHVGFLTDT